ncbi:hypothetical protein D3C86_1616070 [compost metagenome]
MWKNGRHARAYIRTFRERHLTYLHTCHVRDRVQCTRGQYADFDPQFTRAFLGGERKWEQEEEWKEALHRSGLIQIEI